MKLTKKINVKLILISTLWVVLGSALIVLLVAAYNKKESALCTGIKIEIEGATTNIFIDEHDIRSIIQKYAGKKIVGKKIRDFDIEFMEKELEKDVWLKKATIFFDNQGILRANIFEREPMARVFAIDGNTFYIDDEIRILPLSSKHTARLPVFTNFHAIGKNASLNDSNLLKSIKSLSVFIQKDSFLMSMIDQIEINKQNQFELIPKMGRQQIYFGDTSDMNGKFERFTLFYKKVIPKYGWDKYSKVNLQYRGQVVASIKGIEDIEADSMRALQIMKAVAEYSEKAANDTSRSLLLDNASNSTDISFIMQSLQRDEVDSDTAISINASSKKTNIIINKEIANKTKQSPVKNTNKVKPSTQKK